MVLVIDEYHLEIRAEDDLIGRYYLADVEVARDIAERFILFLNDGEMEFLADDALKFAYDGVAAMQEAWLIAQKKRRRHRKAAVQSARRKDREPASEPEPVAARVAEDPLRPQRSREGELRAPAAAPSELAKRLAAAAAAQTAPAPVLETAASARNPAAPTSKGNGQGNRKRSPAKVVAAKARVDESEVVAPPPLEELPSPFDAVEEAPVPTDNKTKAKDGRRARKSKPLEAAKLAAVSAPTIELPTPAPSAPIKEAKEVEVEDPLAVRFAADGHHPAETSVGLLSFLRRPTKVPDNHVHKFRESGSSVGLVRRVCLECSYVSIGSDD
ncbi:MAG TPA: hypothetical protein VFT54_09960 [Acidimicrobiia bacterium]|nr:hypothetical protein [Acidimicrobiia bacterium]